MSYYTSFSAKLAGRSLAARVFLASLWILASAGSQAALASEPSFDWQLLYFQPSLRNGAESEQLWLWSESVPLNMVESRYSETLTAGEKLNIVVEASGLSGIGSVRLELTGPNTVSRTDNAAPYSLFEALPGRSLAAGRYEISATFYPDADGGGAAMATTTETFSLATDETPPAVTVKCSDSPPRVDPDHGQMTLRVKLQPTEAPIELDAYDVVVSQDDDPLFRVLTHNLTLGRVSPRHVSMSFPGDVSGELTVMVPEDAFRDEPGNGNTASALLHVAQNRTVSAGNARAVKAGGATVDFSVTVDARNDCETITVHYATVDGSATAGADYESTTGTLTFAPGEMAKTVSVPVLDDSTDEGPETFALQLSNAVGAALSGATATGTIYDDAETLQTQQQPAALPRVSIVPASSPVTEGAAAVFSLALDSPPSEALTVSVGITESGSMLSASPPQSVTFIAGSTGATLTVSTARDTLGEPDSWITATLTDGSGYVVGARSSATVHVEDESSAQRPVIALACSDVPPSLISNVDLTKSWNVQIDVGVSEPVTGLEAGDFLIPKEPVGALRVMGFHPLRLGRERSLVFHLEEHVSGEVVVTAKSGAARNRAGLHNRASEPLHLARNRTIAAADASAVEASGATVDFTLMLDARNDCETVTLDYATSDITATAGEDYSASNGTLTFAPGETVKTVRVPIVADSTKEGPETFTLQLTNVSGATLAGTSPTGVISDEALTATGLAEALQSAPPAATISPARGSVTEGAAVEFLVTLSEPPSETVTVFVNLAEDGAMLFGPGTRSVTIPAGANSNTLRIPTAADTVVEADSVVMATLGPGTGYAVGASGSAIVTVEDDDRATFVVTAVPEVISEGESATLTVAISNGVTFAEAQTIRLYSQSSNTPGSAASADITGLPVTLTLPAGATSLTTQLVATVDQEDEGGRDGDGCGRAQRKQESAA